MLQFFAFIFLMLEREILVYFWYFRGEYLQLFGAISFMVKWEQIFSKQLNYFFSSMRNISVLEFMFLIIFF